MMVWKMIFLFQGCILWFHVNLLFIYVLSLYKYKYVSLGFFQKKGLYNPRRHRQCKYSRHAQNIHKIVYIYLNIICLHIIRYNISIILWYDIYIYIIYIHVSISTQSQNWLKPGNGPWIQGYSFWKSSFSCSIILEGPSCILDNESNRLTWNPKQPFINGCLVISNHFLCKDWESSHGNGAIYKWLAARGSR